MAFQVEDRVLAESESTERRPRAGTVREVLREDPPRYRIEWDAATSRSTPRPRALCIPSTGPPAPQAEATGPVTRGSTSRSVSARGPGTVETGLLGRARGQRGENRELAAVVNRAVATATRNA